MVNARRILVDWANQQRAWVRTLVAEVVETGQSVPESSIDRLYEMSLAEHGLSDDEVVPGQEIVLEEAGGEDTDRLILTFLREVSGVNLLAEGQEIVFNPKLTILFGENATGKSGYVRILKRAAAVRTAETVLPSIHETKKQTPRAVLGFRLGEREESVVWEDEAGVPPFPRICIFDARAAHVHLDQDLEYVYTPRDLSLFPLVTEALQAVKDRLARDRAARRPGGNPFLPHFDPRAQIYAEFEALGPSTDLSLLEKHAAVNADEAASLQPIRERVQALSAQTVTSQLQVARSDLDLYSQVSQAAEMVSAFSWNDYETKLERLRTATMRHRQATSEVFKDSTMPGVLTPPWHEFITAGDALLKAEEIEGYPSEDSHCIYCGQALNDAARKLLTAYHEYCNNQLKTDVSDAKDSLTSVAKALLEPNTIQLSDLLSARRRTLGESEAPAALTRAIAFVASLRLCQDSIRQGLGLKKDQIPQTAELVRLVEEVVTRLQQAVTDLAVRGRERAEAHAKAVTAVRELESRLTLQRLMPQIRTHVANAKWASKADTILSERFPVLLRSLTQAAKTASEDLLNQDFSERFLRECRALDAPSVSLEFPGRSGQAIRKKVLSSRHRLSDILSEGEQKVIALADFLAEAGIRTSSAPLLFDDPVNSLDYRRLEQVADRLFELAQEQQVIVFTHNIWFATALLSRCNRNPNDCTYYDVERGDGEATGVVTISEHPRYDTPGNLAHRINEVIQEAGRLTGETRQALIERGYSRLRSWCEAVVEQDLLAGVTQRFRPNVMMAALPRIKGERLATAIEAINRVFEKSCRITDAHSQPLEMLNVRSTLADLQEDWEAAQRARADYLAK